MFNVSPYRFTKFGVIRFTRFDIYAKYNAWFSPEAKEFCDALLSKATKRRPHIEKQYAKDKRFTQYWLLKSAVEGSEKRTEQREGFRL